MCQEFGACVLVYPIGIAWVLPALSSDGLLLINGGLLMKALIETFCDLTFYWKPLWWQSGENLAVFGCLLIMLVFAIYRSYRKRKNKEIVNETIDYFANSVYGENSVDEICWDIARNCISRLRFEDCVVYLLDHNSNMLIQKAAYGPKNPKDHEISNPIEIGLGKGIVGWVAAKGKPLLIADTTHDQRYIVDDARRLSEISVPILHEGKVIGVIDSEHRRKGFFTKEHLKALTMIASISANKIAEALASREAHERERKLLEISKLLAESQLRSLRAQMTPHFIFNCLNSIQECIVTRKYEEASQYLTKFSKLFRLVLDNSERSLVTIEEELSVLELYIQLEQMRFDQSFSYRIVVDEELEIEEILFPSMLLQAYVENALWHGLMHATGERLMTVEFRRINEHVFQCRIDDSGIGRKKSIEIKNRSERGKNYRSFGMKISSERLHLLDIQGHHAGVEVVDKCDENGNACGTLVIIELSTYLSNP